MVRIRVFKLSQIIYYAIIIVVAVALIGLIASALLGGDDAQPSPTPGGVTTSTPDTVVVPQQEDISRSGGADRPGLIAATANAEGKGLDPPGESPGLLRRLSTWLFSFDPGDPLSILGVHLPVTEKQAPPQSQQATAALLSADGEEIGENELTDAQETAEHILVEIARIEEPYTPPSRGRILIYHTHTYEAYQQDEDDPYKEASAAWRTKERDKSIVGVGDVLERHLTALGYEVVHDVTEFEPPKLGTAYIRSLEMLDGRVAAGEEYAMIIDLHRDAWDTVQEKQMTAPVDGEPAARLMMLIGTGEGSEGNSFSIKPNWKENYKLADALTANLNERYPGLCRDIMLKTGRYNQHISEHSVLIEVGNNRNTLQEAMNAMGPLAEAIDAALRGE